ncbi:small GTP-binding protein domain-containing protein [Polaribacter sp. KT25b]|uniref:Rab family GTPase n=1 Tax=Polaribacter sp. KT25b TaxID=1855336 RepID=UPI00087A415E|nr:Rab family GTPase [Polaribacter sp. KT25b]SDR82403.1 small GTP-binding protein domain-containing protein [Polaribacter sp. KT25b]
MIAKKVLLVGNFGVGKTSLIRRFVLNEFSEEYISTIGVRVSSKIIQIDKEEIKLLIWDVAGTSDDEKVPKAYFLGASAAMFVFDLSREETYKSIKNQVEVVKQLSGLKNITVVGNKKDLVSVDEIEQLKKSISISVDLITSAKDNENVEDAFKELAKQTLN